MLVNYGPRIVVDLGQTISTLRHKRHLTQEELAQRAGISAPHLSRIESGQVLPSAAVLERLCVELGIGPRVGKSLSRRREELGMRASVQRLGEVIAESEEQARRLSELHERIRDLESRLAVLERAPRAPKRSPRGQ
jgi:transcriptional regulator with XRE-family HTH domain